MVYSVSLRSVVVGPNFLFDDVIGMCVVLSYDVLCLIEVGGGRILPIFVDVIGMCVVLNYDVLCLIEVGGGRIHLYLLMSLVCV